MRLMVASGPGKDGCLQAIGISGIIDAEYLRMYTVPSPPGAQSMSESMGSVNEKGRWSTSPELPAERATWRQESAT